MGGKKWTASEVAVLRANYGKILIKELGGRLNRTSEAVKLKARALRLRSARFWTKEETTFLHENYGELSLKMLMQKLGKSKRSIYSKAQRMKFHYTMDTHIRINTDLPEPEWGYVSGLIDADGWIGVAGMQPIIQLTNTSRKMIEKVQGLLQTETPEYTELKGEWKPKYDIRIQRTADVKALAGKIRKYVTAKQQQCRLVLEFCNSRLQKRLNAPYSKRERQIAR